MNNQLAYLCFLSGAAGFFAQRCYVIIHEYFERKRRAKEYASAVAATDENTCKGPHSWDNITLALSFIPVGDYRVCTSCGLIAMDGPRCKLNEPGLEVYRGTLKRRAAKKLRWENALKIKHQFAEEIMKKLIRNHIQEFDGDMDKNIQALQQFFRRSNIELDDMYAKLNEKLENENNRG